MNINATLIAQAVVMIVFVAICWRYIYPPILSVMKEREKRISDGLEAAKKADDSLEAEKILNSASTTIENETNKAKEELRQQMSDIIIDTTQKILGDEISKEKHEEILKKAAEEL